MGRGHRSPTSPLARHGAWDGQLIYTRRGAYAPRRQACLIKGRVGRVIGDGFGFLVPDGGGDDLFLKPARCALVFDGDRGAGGRITGVRPPVAAVKEPLSKILETRPTRFWWAAY